MGQRESTGLLEVCEEGETEGDAIERKDRKVIDNPNRSFLSRMFSSCWPIRPKREIESHEPGDHAVQSEASVTGPMVRYLEGGVNEKRRGQREITALLEVCEEGEMEGDAIERKDRKVIDNLNRSFFRRMFLSFRQSHAK